MKSHRADPGGYPRRIIIAVLVLLGLFAVGEIALRCYGFCQAPLYYNSEYTGFNLKPNQNVKRFGNTYSTNEYSMRSESLTEDENRVLLIGDSVLNGGVQTDQSELASTILEEEMQEEFSGSVTPRVLNVSCGAWGIDNSVGVIKECGDFSTGKIILVFNSHDAIGTIPDYEVAGNSVSFPDKQYPLAWAELLDRYLIPRVESKTGINLPGGNKKNEVDSTNASEGSEHSEGWQFYADYCSEKDIELSIYLHAELEEVRDGAYDEDGQWIIDFAEQNDIPIVFDIDRLDETDFRDSIHLNPQGQKVMAEILEPEIKEYFSE